MNKAFKTTIATALLLCSMQAMAFTDSLAAKEMKPAATVAGITLPQGFTAVKLAENIGAARHITVTPQGDIYVKLADVKDGKSILVLHENTPGQAQVTAGFGNFGGTGIAVKNGYLYASSDDNIYRYKLDANNKVIDGSQPEIVVKNLVNRHHHSSKSIALDNDGNLYVNIGAPSNICAQRGNEKLGQQPCPLLDSTAAIWMFKADKLNQTYADGVRYTSGLRNVVGLDWNTTTNTLFVMQHGRDNLSTTFPEYYTSQQSAELPAECMFELHKGDNAGWPYIYYDWKTHKKMLCPEYGGDGKKTGGDDEIDPVVGFPGHMAPNALLFYTGTQFPEKYRNGAFIAFHGSWNRAPEPQKGYLVAFVPFKDGKPSGDWEIFANDFAGGAEFMQPGKAKHRPCGLAQGPDGSLYVSDDSGGTIYKISYGK